jgi:SPASM domain peptide maturase of grasp-with-spasm system
MNEQVFKLYANCIPVKGARRSTICDLQLYRYDFIPNGLYHILTSMKDLSIADIKAAFPAFQHNIIDEYFEFLLEKDYGFFCSEPHLFPDLELSWMAPQQITNAIIDVDDQSRHPFESIFAQLDSLGCRALQLRFFSAVSLEELGRILEMTGRGVLRHIDLLLPYSEGFSDEVLQGICSEHQRISRIAVYSAPASRTVRVPHTNVPISFTTARCDSPTCCGESSPKFFVINMEHFTEAQEWNSCLNRKISISADGYIKNCPSLPDSFGHISTVPLSDALAAPHYKDLWAITKDQVKVCRDCEFRYICIDCRAYREDSDDVNSKPLKCAYDPYSAEWRRPGVETS